MTLDEARDMMNKSDVRFVGVGVFYAPKIIVTLIDVIEKQQRLIEDLQRAAIAHHSKSPPKEMEQMVEAAIENGENEINGAGKEAKRARGVAALMGKEKKA